VRFAVERLAPPARGGEEEADPSLPFGVTVVDDMSEGGIDADAGLLGCLADRAADD
jgi:hypothetical protein